MVALGRDQYPGSAKELKQEAATDPIYRQARCRRARISARPDMAAPLRRPGDPHRYVFTSMR